MSLWQNATYALSEVKHKVELKLKLKQIGNEMSVQTSMLDGVSLYI